MSRSNTRIVVLTVLLSLAFYIIGFHIAKGTITPVVEHQFIDRPIVEYETQIVTEYVEVPVEVPVEVEVEVPQKLRRFDSVEELEDWLEQNPVDHTKFIYDHGLGDCDDYALELVEDAKLDGFEMWFQVLHHPYRQPITDKLLTKKSADHAVCSVIISDEVYYIEPQTDEIWLAGYID